MRKGKMRGIDKPMEPVFKDGKDGRKPAKGHKLMPVDQPGKFEARRNIRPAYKVDLNGRRVPIDGNRWNDRIHTPARNFDWIPDSLKGMTVFIVGSGTSLKGFDYNRLIGQFVIAINQEIVWLKDIAKWWCFGDHTTVDRAMVRPSEFAGKTIIMDSTKSHNLNDEDMKEITVVHRRRDPFEQISYKPEAGFFARTTTTTFALNAAICAGAGLIYLLGIDCHIPQGEIGHHYSLCKERNHPVFYRKMHDTDRQDGRYRNHIRDFDKFLHLKNIINLSPISELKFRKKRVDDVL